MEAAHFFLLLALSGATAAPHAALSPPGQDDMWERGFRLDGTLVPTHYQITITPDDESFQTFAGNVVIDFEVKFDAREIILHAGDPLVFRALPTVEEIGGGAASIRSYEHVPADELLHIRLDQPALEMDHKYRITIDYTGSLSMDQRGFFRASVQDGEKTSFLAMTQFSPIYARRAFPCFDEPSYQATFALSIAHPAGLAARATTPVSTTSHTGNANGFVLTTFETTAAISPHSLSWLVTDLAFSGEPHDQVRTYGRGAVGLPVADLHSWSKALLQLLEQYTDLPGPQQVDQVVVPLLEATAGGSAGVVAYREEAVLPHKQYKSSTRLAGMLSVAKGLAQQWFGIAVTPSWWGHAWLAEGFGRLMQYALVDKTHPELQMLERFGVMETMQALAADCQPDAQPITSDGISKNSEVLANVAGLSAAKGAGVLRMLQKMITEATFQKGVQYYLSDMKSKTSTPDDLWTAMQRAADEDETAPDVSIAKFGRSWTEQAGYPVLTAVRNYEMNTVLVYQTPFPLSISAAGEDPSGPAWWVPLQLSSNTVDDLDDDVRMIDARVPVVDAWGPDSSKEWLIVNKDHAGYYRVNYDMFNWLRLVRAFNEDPDDKLPPEGARAMLLDDALTLAEVGLLDYPVAVHLAEALLVRERQPAPWIVASRHLGRLAKFFRGSSSEHSIAFDRWVRSLVDGAFAELGFPDDEDEVVAALPRGALRALVTKIACEAMHPECAAAARRQYLRWRNGDSVSGDSLALAVCHGVTGPWARSDALSHALAAVRGSGADREDVIQGMGCLTGQHRKDLLQSLVSGSDLNAEETRMVWRALAARQTGLRLALDALRDHRDEIVNNFDEEFFANVLLDIAPSVATEDQLAAVRELASQLDSVTGTDVIGQAAVRVAQDNLDWRQQYLLAVLDEMAPSAADRKGLSHLPDKVVPVHYDLRLNTDPKDIAVDQAPSAVQIIVVAMEDTDLLSLHAGKGLILKHLVVTDDANEALVQWYNPNTDYSGYEPWNTFGQDSEIVSVRLDTPMLADNTYSVAIEFIHGYDVQAGDLEGGLFVNTLPDGLATVTGVRMEPRFAHHVFPCFDEPQFLATFSLRLAVTGTQKQALSVSPQMSSSPDPALPGMTVVNFAMTRPLPAHLLGVAVFDSETTAGATASPSKPVPGGSTPTVTSVRVRREVEKSVAAAARQASDLLQLLDGAVGKRSPLARQEIVAVPQLQGGAVISPSLALLREGDMLVDDKTSASEQALRSALALANAQAHCFLGNDVLLEGWGGLWLREGLAAYLESWAVDQLDGGRYGAVAWAGVDRLHRGLSLDAMETAAALASAEGDVVADKGVGIVRMLAGLMGEKALLRGLQAVMRSAPGKLADVEVLETLERASDQPPPVKLVDFAESWTSQPGFPVLTVTRDYEAGSILISQERFEATPSTPSTPSDSRTWIVPFNVVTAKSSDAAAAPRLVDVLSGRSTTVSVVAEAEDYVLVNAGQLGFYRVNYDLQNWQLLTKAVEAGQLPEAQRAALLGDAVALCRAGRLDVVVVLELLKAVAAMPSDAALCVPCWVAVRDALATLGHLTRHSPPEHRAMYKRFIAEKLVQPSSVEWSAQEGEDWAHGAMRAVLSQVACAAENEDCLNEANAAAKAWAANRDATSLGVDADVLAPTVCYLMSRAPEAADFTEVNVRLASTEDASVRAAYIAGLGCVRDEAMRKILLKTTATKSGVDISDVLPMFVSMMDNSDASLDQVTDFVVDNFVEMTQKLGQDVADTVIYAVAERAHADQHYTKILSLLDTTSSPSSLLKAAVRRAAVNRAWSAAAQPKLVAWVYEQLGEDPPVVPTTPGSWTQSPTKPPTARPPTVEPPTARPPTVEPPTAKPPTARPPTVEPPTAKPPPTAQPKPTSRPPTPTPTPTPKPSSARRASLNLLIILLSMSTFFLQARRPST